MDGWPHGQETREQLLLRRSRRRRSLHPWRDREPGVYNLDHLDGEPAERNVSLQRNKKIFVSAVDALFVTVMTTCALWRKYTASFLEVDMDGIRHKSEPRLGEP